MPYSSELKSLECDSPDAPICMNGGVCFDMSKLSRERKMNHMTCYCSKEYFGPHCEFSANELHLDRKTTTARKAIIVKRKVGNFKEVERSTKRIRKIQKTLKVQKKVDRRVTMLSKVIGKFKQNARDNKDCILDTFSLL